MLKGSCHCGATKFEVTSAPETVTYCTCSNCSKRGALWAYYPATEFNLLTSRRNVATYQWGVKIEKFHFCPVCGNSTFTENMDWSTGDGPMVSVNARLFDDFDLDAVPVEVIDGKNLS
jgi:hypothetical protein